MGPHYIIPLRALKRLEHKLLILALCSVILRKLKKNQFTFSGMMRFFEDFKDIENP